MEKPTGNQCRRTRQSDSETDWCESDVGTGPILFGEKMFFLWNSCANTDTLHGHLLQLRNLCLTLTVLWLIIIAGSLFCKKKKKRAENQGENTCGDVIIRCLLIDLEVKCIEWD